MNYTPVPEPMDQDTWNRFLRGEIIFVGTRRPAPAPWWAIALAWLVVIYYVVHR